MPRQLDHMFPQSSLLPPRFYQPQIEPVWALRIALTSAPHFLKTNVHSDQVSSKMYPSVRAPFQSLVVTGKDHIVPHFTIIVTLIISWRTLISYGTPTVRHFLTFPTTRMPYKLQEIVMIMTPIIVSNPTITYSWERWTTLFSGNLLHAKATHALHTARRLIQISQNFPHWFISGDRH